MLMQIGAMVRYELLMAWRRRILLLLVGLLLIATVFFGQVVGDSSAVSTMSVQVDPATGEVVQSGGSDVNLNEVAPWLIGVNYPVAVNTMAIIQVLIAVMVVGAIGMTAFLGEVIPLDRHYQVRELLDALPINNTTYLGGKALGVVVLVLIVVLGAAVIGGAALHFVVGNYDGRVYAVMWALMILPPVLLSALLAVLLCSWTARRRAAVMISLILMPFIVILLFFGVPALGGAGVIVHESYALSILLVPSADSTAVILQRIRDVLVLYAAVLGVAWLAIWTYMRLRSVR